MNKEIELLNKKLDAQDKIIKTQDKIINTQALEIANLNKALLDIKEYIKEKYEMSDKEYLCLLSNNKYEPDDNEKILIGIVDIVNKALGEKE